MMIMLMTPLHIAVVLVLATSIVAAIPLPAALHILSPTDKTLILHPRAPDLILWSLSSLFAPFPILYVSPPTCPFGKEELTCLDLSYLPDATHVHTVQTCSPVTDNAQKQTPMHRPSGQPRIGRWPSTAAAWARRG